MAALRWKEPGEHEEQKGGQGGWWRGQRGAQHGGRAEANEDSRKRRERMRAFNAVHDLSSTRHTP